MVIRMVDAEITMSFKPFECTSERWRVRDTFTVVCTDDRHAMLRLESVKNDGIMHIHRDEFLKMDFEPEKDTPFELTVDIFYDGSLDVSRIYDCRPVGVRVLD